jgi:hypothetical protein
METAIMTTTTSRRAVLAGVAALPVATTPALAAVANPDAELLALGERFDALMKLYDDAEVRSEPYQTAFSREGAKLAETAPNPDGVWEELCDRLEREYPIAYPTCDDVIDLTGEPSRQIMALPAFTPEGLAVKARLARFHCSHFWRVADEEKADWDDLVARKLIDAVLAMGAQS